MGSGARSTTSPPFGQVVRAITGHVTEAMTERYSHVDANEKRAALEAVVDLMGPPLALQPEVIPPKSGNATA